MFDPVSLLTTSSPWAPSATASSLVVVVLPFVPLIRATRRPAVNRRRSCGSTLRPARPPATVPWPRPRRRDVALTARVVVSARRYLTAPSRRRFGARQFGGRRLVTHSRFFGEQFGNGRHDGSGVLDRVAQCERNRPTDRNSDLWGVAHERHVGHPGRARPYRLGTPQADR